MNLILRIILLAACFSLGTLGQSQDQAVLGSPQYTRRPNIVMILTDDQDLRMDSMKYMPFTHKHIAEHGVTYNNHYCTVSLCCPSRVNMWTGKAAHNTNITDLSPPYGGYLRFVSQGLNEAYLPVWLQKLGYQTYYVGKLFNTHNVRNYDKPYPAGWTGSDFLLDPHTYSYMKSVFQRNKDPPKSYEGHYSTDVVANKSLGFLEDALESEKPFFLGIAPIAPHCDIEIAGTPQRLRPPVAHERHAGWFKDAIVPRTPNFNPEQPSGIDWVRKLPRQHDKAVKSNDEFYRKRLQSLQPVDEMVDAVVRLLKSKGQLDNTFIIYTTDNGYHIGQHRMHPGKQCSYEEDIHIPLVIRGPNMPRNISSDITSSHSDIVPTIIRLAGGDLHEDFDGTPIPLTETEHSLEAPNHPEHANIEHWGGAGIEGKYGWEGWEDRDKNTYKALRLIGKGYNFYYAVWCNGSAHEMYDLINDPYQMNNLSDPSTQLLGWPLAKVANRLDSLLLVLKSCKGGSCRNPWGVLHPDGKVANLHHALREEYDEFYVTQYKVSFSRCVKGYLLDAEGPQEPQIYRNGLHWSDWV